jgi:hypothetical protein
MDNPSSSGTTRKISLDQLGDALNIVVSNPFNQTLNTTDSPTFSGVSLPNNVELNGSGIVFSDNTSQTTAGIISNTGAVSGSSPINNIIQISQANYDSLPTKNSNTLYIIND